VLKRKAQEKVTEEEWETLDFKDEGHKISRLETPTRHSGAGVLGRR
jgi:hypothetical protein